jgi:hypothetical protein
LYLFAFAVNWRDEPPNAESQQLAAIAPRAPIPDEANAYVYVLGFAVPRVGDPAQVGASRAQWIRALAADASIPPSSDPYPGSAPEFQNVPEALAAVLTPCSTGDAGCVAAFEAASGTLRQALDEQRPLIERYRTLLGFGAWQEITTGDLRSPFVSYAEVGYARRLFLLDTWLIAVAGDAKEVRARLTADIAFWRMALASSAWLSSKSIATSYVGQNFVWGNLILRRLPPENRADGIPEAWRRALTQNERSMQRAFSSEWRVIDAAMRSMKRHGVLTPAPEGAKDPRSTFDRVLEPLALPLFQPQATVNRFAAMYVKLETLLDVPYSELGAALAHVPETDEPPHGVLGFTYNLLGHAFAPPEPSVFADYAVRVADLEGARRAAVLAVDLRVLKIPPELAGSMVALAASRDPYTGGPFPWTADPAMISFTGLERASVTRYRFLY